MQQLQQTTCTTQSCESPPLQHSTNELDALAESIHGGEHVETRETGEVGQVWLVEL
jgi:hypothetical protein